jgi:hypothetical protein
MQRCRISWSLVLLGLVIPCAAVNPEGTGQPRPLTPPQHFQKLAHTYSIVAWDPDNGDLGVAVQSKFPNVGGIVPWARAGVGAVATQSLANTAYGERALELMAQGATAEEALRVVMRTDTSLQDRQVGMVDAHGNAVRVTVVFLGDYIDRGPRTRDCIDAILELPDRHGVELVCLRGNHEDWMPSPSTHKYDDVLLAQDFVLREPDGGIYVHAGLDPAIDQMDEQSLEALLWGHPGFPASYLGSHEVVYGHRGDRN